ncbi:LytS/YehU family sensor histidine kinase [Filimonas zeae]|uniref:Histidine kinase n=1 Tax=Filimonas zeae TaxID=1737353 RepID=A0A917IYH7_9BACT|nr:histidine kinase [Filimonas zeae]MDR6338569.1 LytS/YehU family sensor histidine kinase [Filimonas zeae]GGH67619.1 histidine kinase [Filimonas zeae]
MKPAFSDSSFYRSFLTWWLVCAIIHVAVIYNEPYGILLCVTDSIVSNSLLAASCLLIINNMRYYLPRQEKYWYILVISTVLGVICMLVSQWLLMLIGSSTPVYAAFVKDSSTIRFAFDTLLVGFIAMFGLLWYTQREQTQAARRQADAEKMTRDAELFRLREQLQPHFLFNSLNSISALTRSEPEKARHMIQQLSDFLRGTLRKEQKQWVPLQEELADLQLYLEIEKVRFGHRLQTNIICSDEACKLNIPALLLQPVVENAIKFGLYDTTDTVNIELQAREEKEALIVSVSNPFDPETSVAGKGTGFGLASVQRRLFLLFARADLVQTHTDNTTFTTTLIIPQIHDKDHTDR